jgi:xylono-1,5-lactonase
MSKANSTYCVWDEPCSLGEAPVWHPLENVLYWVDILGPKLHRLDIHHHHHQSWTMPTSITCIAPNQHGGLIVAFKHGIAILNPISNQVHYLDSLSDEIAALSMFNDGHCDRQGRFWVGTKNINETSLLNAKPQGEIFRFGPDQALIKQVENFYITNGLVFNLDSKYFFVADSPRRVIYRYEFDSESGQIHHPIVFAKIATDAGFPDGMTLDSEGYLWSCHFGGWRITRYSPEGKGCDSI